MKAGQIWSEEFGCYVSRAFMPRKEKQINLDITNCIIKITTLGFYYLWLNGKKIKQIKFDEFLLYKNYVREIKEEEDYSC